MPLIGTSGTQTGFDQIRDEYGLTGQFSMGQCAGLNGGLPGSATAQVSVNTFQTAARYGPDSYTLTRAVDPVFGISYGMAQSPAFGSMSPNRSVKEVTSQWQEIFTNTATSKSYIKITNYTQVWQLWHNLSDVWASGKTWIPADSRYEWNASWFTNTGSTAIIIRYNG